MKNEFMNVPIFTGEGKVHFEERKIPTPGDNQLLIQAKAIYYVDLIEINFTMEALNVFQVMKELE